MKNVSGIECMCVGGWVVSRAANHSWMCFDGVWSGYENDIQIPHTLPPELLIIHTCTLTPLNLENHTLKLWYSDTSTLWNFYITTLTRNRLNHCIMCQCCTGRMLWECENRSMRLSGGMVSGGWLWELISTAIYRVEKTMTISCVPWILYWIR